MIEKGTYLNISQKQRLWNAYDETSVKSNQIQSQISMYKKHYEAQWFILRWYLHDTSAKYVCATASMLKGLT